MKPVSQTPTESIDYAALTALYGTLLAATASPFAAARRSAAPSSCRSARAQFALLQLVVPERVESSLRRPFIKLPGGASPAGSEFATPSASAELHALIGVERARHRRAPADAPPARRSLTLLAASAGDDFLQTGFASACWQSDVRKRRARRPRAGGRRAPGRLSAPLTGISQDSSV